MQRLSSPVILDQRLLVVESSQWKVPRKRSHLDFLSSWKKVRGIYSVIYIAVCFNII